MLLLIQSIPTIKWLYSDTYEFGSSWLVTVTGTKNLFDMIYWCRENYNDTKIQYYRHGSDKWFDVNSSDIGLSYTNNINDSLRVRFKDEEDVMAFKLMWME